MNNFPLSALPFLGAFLDASPAFDVLRNLSGPQVSRNSTRTKGRKFASQKSRANRRKGAVKARGKR